MNVSASGFRGSCGEAACGQAPQPGGLVPGSRRPSPAPRTAFVTLPTTPLWACPPVAPSQPQRPPAQPSSPPPAGGRPRRSGNLRRGRRAVRSRKGQHARRGRGPSPRSSDRTLCFLGHRRPAPPRARSSEAAVGPSGDSLLRTLGRPPCSTGPGGRGLSQLDGGRGHGMRGLHEPRHRPGQRWGRRWAARRRWWRRAAEPGGIASREPGPRGVSLSPGRCPALKKAVEAPHGLKEAGGQGGVCHVVHTVLRVPVWLCSSRCRCPIRAKEHCLSSALRPAGCRSRSATGSSRSGGEPWGPCPWPSAAVRVSGQRVQGDLDPHGRPQEPRPPRLECGPRCAGCQEKHPQSWAPPAGAGGQEAPAWGPSVYGPDSKGRVGGGGAARGSGWPTNQWCAAASGADSSSLGGGTVVPMVPRLWPQWPSLAGSPLPSDRQDRRSPGQPASRAGIPSPLDDAGPREPSPGPAGGQAGTGACVPVPVPGVRQATGASRPSTLRTTPQLCLGPPGWVSVGVWASLDRFGEQTPNLYWVLCWEVRGSSGGWGRRAGS